MSGLLNSSLNGSTSSLPDSTGRSFSSSFSAESGAGFPLFHPTGLSFAGNIQGLHTIHGNFNVPNMPGALGSRSTIMNDIASSGMQQAAGNLSTGCYASNNLPVALSQISHSSAHVHSGMASRGGMSLIGNQGYSSNTYGVGGSIPGILPTSAAIGSRTTVPGLGGNAGPRITSSMGNIVGGGNIGRNSSSGGLSISGLASRLNLTSIAVLEI